MNISKIGAPTSFKMALVADEPARKLLNDSLNGKQLHKLNKWIDKQEKNPNDVFLSVKTVQGQEQPSLTATTVNKTFYQADTLSNKPLTAIKKAINYSNKFKNVTPDKILNKMNKQNQ